MPHISPILAVVASIVGAMGVLVWRVREGRTPVTLRKIIIPPLGMSTGFSMFFFSITRIPALWALGAFLIGAILLALPLLITSRLTLVNGTVMMQRSSAFFAVIIFLAAIRILARSYFDNILTVPQTGALFFVLAFGMILRWRLSMLFAYLRLTNTTVEEALEPAQD